MKSNRAILLQPVCAATAILLILSACANVTHTMLYQDNHLGLYGGYNPETSAANLTVGYKSNFVLIAPKVNVVDSSGTAQYKAASVYEGSHMVVHGLGVPDVSEFMATGTAAVLVAKSKNAAKPVSTGSAANAGQ